MKLILEDITFVIVTYHSDDFIQRALDKWQSTSKGARVSALKQAMESTLSG